MVRRECGVGESAAHFAGDDLYAQPDGEQRDRRRSAALRAPNRLRFGCRATAQFERRANKRRAAAGGRHRDEQATASARSRCLVFRRPRRGAALQRAHRPLRRAKHGFFRSVWRASGARCRQFSQPPGAVVNVIGTVATPIVLRRLGAWAIMIVRFLMGCGQVVLVRSWSGVEKVASKTVPRSC